MQVTALDLVVESHPALLRHSTQPGRTAR